MGRRYSTPLLMARPLSYTDRAMAGADTLNRIANDVVDEKRFRYTVERQEKQDERQADRDAKADLRYEAQETRQAALDEQALIREKRIAEGEKLRNEMMRRQDEKETTQDANAARMKIETDREATEGANELFKINTADDNAMEKLADWGAKYFRALDEKTGDPRLIKQFQINQSRAENRQLLKMKADELRLAREEKEKADKKPETWKSWGEDLEAAKTAHGGEANVPPEVWKQFEERKKALVSPAAQTAPVVDKLAMAKAALSDPQASEAHKAAARKILGL